MRELRADDRGPGRRRSRALALLALALGALALAVVLVGRPELETACGESLNRAEVVRDGLSNAEAEEAVRCDDLRGKRRREVRALLGSPDPTSSEGRAWTYVLPDWKGWVLPDGTALTVTFDARGVVAGASVGRSRASSRPSLRRRARPPGTARVATPARPENANGPPTATLFSSIGSAAEKLEPIQSVLARCRSMGARGPTVHGPRRTRDPCTFATHVRHARSPRRPGNGRGPAQAPRGNRSRRVRSWRYRSGLQSGAKSTSTSARSPRRGA